MAKNPKAAQDWFRQKARTAAQFRANLVGNTDRLRNDIAIGKMYFFFYDPKHKDKLPVYDRFPLVFPIERYGDGFLGLNLHYITVSERQYLLDKLMKYTTTSTLSPRTKLELSYELLFKASKSYGLARPCIKRYLRTHFRSRFVEITPDEWDRVLDLPVADFVTKA